MNICENFEFFKANIGVDKAENEPPKILWDGGFQTGDAPVVFSNSWRWQCVVRLAGLGALSRGSLSWPDPEQRDRQGQTLPLRSPLLLQRFPSFCTLINIPTTLNRISVVWIAASLTELEFCVITIFLSSFKTNLLQYMYTNLYYSYQYDIFFSSKARTAAYLDASNSAFRLLKLLATSNPVKSHK